MIRDKKISIFSDKFAHFQARLGLRGRLRYARVMRASSLARFAVLVALSGACGGRLVKSGTDEESGAAANGGADASSGAPPSTGAAGHSSRAGQSNGGAVGRAGAGGATATAGTTSAGGACACDSIACGIGFETIPNVDGCCYHCECNAKLCPGIACASGSHLETPPDQCCPVCLQNDCATQRQGYQDFKKQLLDKYAYGCMTADECTVYYDNNACGSDCGSVVWNGALDNLKSNLEGYAQQNCSVKCAGPVPPCDPSPMTGSCVNGRCQ